MVPVEPEGMVSVTVNPAASAPVAVAITGLLTSSAASEPPGDAGRGGQRARLARVEQAAAALHLADGLRRSCRRPTPCPG